MKIFFSLLLLANIGFGLMQWLLPYEQLFEDNPKIALAESLKLLNEAKKSTVVESSGSNAETAVAKVLVSEKTENQQVCYTVGPFKDKTRALEVSGRYSVRQIKTELKSSLEKEYMGVMVFVPGHKTRQQAAATAEALGAKGIRDYIIINEGDKINVLSLGVFALKKNADRLTARVKQLNYPVGTEPRYRDQTIYWLYYQHSNESEPPSVLDEKDRANGVGQIPRQCT